MLSALLPPKMEKGPKSAPKFFSDSFQFLAESCVLRPPLCIKKPFCEAVLRVLAGSCTQNSTPFHIFSFFMKTHKGAQRGPCSGPQRLCDDHRGQRGVRRGLHPAGAGPIARQKSIFWLRSVFSAGCGLFCAARESPGGRYAAGFGYPAQKVQK